jgi:hypothetical protein
MAPVAITTLDEFLAWLKPQPASRPYDSNTEDMPDHDLFRLPRVTIDGELEAYAQLIIVCLEGSPPDDKELGHIVKTARATSKVTQRPPKFFFFIGPQNAGKSQLICALFDLDGISPTDLNGRACTSTPIRSTHYEEGRGNPKKVHGNIKFLRAKELELMFKELSRHYYNFYHANDDEDEGDIEGDVEGEGDHDEEKPSSQPSPDRGNMKSLKDTAEDILVALWGSKESLLRSWSPGSFKNGDFVELCQHKFNEAIEDQNLDGQSISHKMGTDQHHLMKQMRRFMSQVDGEKCFWHLVDDITVKLYHAMLEQNID